VASDASTSGVAAVAPQAAGYTWYPQSFLAPMEMNQPYLDSALARVESITAEAKIGEIYTGNLYFGEDLMEIPFGSPAPAKLD